MNQRNFYRTIFQFFSGLLISALLLGCGAGDSNGSNSTGTPAATYSITGAVSGDTLSGVTINLTGSATSSATTDANGSYSFTAISNGNYTITPSKPGFTFNQSSLTFSVSGANVTGKNFTATSTTTANYDLTGTVTGAVTQNVLITLSGASTNTTITDANGNYRFTGLPNGVYTAKPSLSGYTFNPTSSQKTINNANVAFDNFVSSKIPTGSTYTLSGKVSGDTQQGVTIKLSGAASNSTITDATGGFSFANLSNGAYTLTPSKTNYSFNPISTSVTLKDANDSTTSFISTAPIIIDPPPTKTITLIHFNDLHAHLTPHWDRVAVPAVGITPATTKIEERGGLARAKTIINQIRASNLGNSILMNIGDTYHGGVEASYTLGNAVIAPMDGLGVDIGVPGNWDFSYGPDATNARYGSNASFNSGLPLKPTLPVQRPKFKNIAANLTYTDGTQVMDPTWTTTVNGVKIGFIGITSDIVPRMSTLLATGFTFLTIESDYIKLIQDTAKTLRDGGAQLVFVMSELGIHKDKQLADKIISGRVDGFFSAHTHEATFTKLVSTSGAFVVEAGNDGYVGRMDVTVTPGTPLKPDNFVWQLLPILSTTAEDATMKALVDAARKPFLNASTSAPIAYPMPAPLNVSSISQPITTKVGKTMGALDRRGAIKYSMGGSTQESFNGAFQNSFNQVFADALRAKTKTDLVITPGFRFDSVMLEDNPSVVNDITIEDVYRFFPTVYNIGVGTITGKQLMSNMEQGLENVYSTNAFNQNGGWFEGYSGVSVNVNITKAAGARIATATMANGNPVNPNSTYTITGCIRPGDTLSALLCDYPTTTAQYLNINGTGSRFPINAYTVQEMFLQLLAPNGSIVPLSVGAPHHTDTSGIKAWPNSPYIQPIWNLP